MAGAHNSTPKIVDGIRFASKDEAARYRTLALLERAGEINDLTPHPKFPLVPGFSCGGKRIQAITYEADFMYRDQNGRLIVEDVKGVGWNKAKTKRIPRVTEATRLRIKLLLWFAPSFDELFEFRLVNANGEILQSWDTWDSKC